MLPQVNVRYMYMYGHKLKEDIIVPLKTYMYDTLTDKNRNIQDPINYKIIKFLL